MVLSRLTGLYDRVASSYHALWLPVIEPAGVHLLDLLEAAVAARPEALIVDIGAGTGTLGRAAVARWPGVRVISIDPSEAMLAVGRAAAASSLGAPALGRLDWVRGTAERLPVDSASADIVASSFTWQYLPARAPAYREARRVLQPGGVLAVMTWLLDDWPFLPWRQLSEVLDGLGVERPPFPRVAGPFRSLSSAAAAVRRAGFREVRAVEGLVDHQWTTDALVRCTLEEEERELFDRLDAATCRAVERLWRERLAGLGQSDLRYRGAVAYVTGRVRLPVAEAPELVGAARSPWLLFVRVGLGTSGSGSHGARIHTGCAVVAAPALDRAFARWCFTVDIDAERSIGIVSALTLYAMYEELISVQGWTPDACEAWLADSLISGVVG